MTDVRIIEDLIGPSLESMGFRLVRVSYGGGGRPTLQVMAEPLDGSPMTVNHCADISRLVSSVLDVEDPIPTAYMLEVTSPGIDRPLVSRGDYTRFAGFEAKIELSRPVDGRKRLSGRILGIDEEDKITISETGTTASFPFDAIHKAKLVLTDELIAATESNAFPPPDQPAADTDIETET